MAINFPASPSLNDTYTTGGVTYVWDGATWKASASISETDPIFTASAASSIISSQITNWDTAYGWGNHANAGYLTTFTETDPIFNASAASTITGTQVSNWDTSYGWGDHSAAGYLTSYTETDTLDTVLARGATTTRDITTTGKIYYSNNFATTGDLPNASTYHGMFAHVHAAGHGYFAHGGVWVQILDTGSVIGELSNVATTAPNVNDVLTWDGSNWSPAAAGGGGGSSLQSRTTAQGTTATIADGASADITISAAKTYALQKIQTSAAAWVTLYSDTGSRTNDASRNESTDPLPGSGVIAEVITTGAAIQKITPGTIGWNDDGVPSSNVYLKVVNKSGSSQAITVTLHYVQLEA